MVIAALIPLQHYTHPIQVSALLAEVDNMDIELNSLGGRNLTALTIRCPHLKLNKPTGI